MVLLIPMFIDSTHCLVDFQRSTLSVLITAVNIINMFICVAVGGHCQSNDWQVTVGHRTSVAIRRGVCKYRVVVTRAYFA
jgi:hypothetical protein